ncbi:hypothetical protein F53441_3039 [Fusarium austroafricanum]|uniref:Uncharacterized protein n=1 Tax=Fusarium austroafricanum TaxID=2364996 RepID=A0A8H4P283_9HYPO|nr:hypothetical protein F53441_3039 [Fusarium austroafricanum]
MVYVPPASPDCLTAYLATTFTDDELKAFKSAFELGACSKFNPMLEIKIVHAPDDYLGKSHQYMRAKENEAGNEGPFLVIDDEAKERGAAWYVSTFASDEEVEDEEAESTDAVWKILIKTEALALAHVNYDIANMSIGEDLDNAGVELPLTNDFHQPELNDCGGIDFYEEQSRQDTWVTAEPGEFEESTDPENLNNFMPRPDKVARLKEEVARSVGIVPRWAIPSEAGPVENDDGTQIEFPEGSVVLQQAYNPDHPWPEASWPEGSL